MGEPGSISIVIPLYNEQENVSLLYEELKTVLRTIELPYEIIFVDDGSTDSSFSILKKMAAEDVDIKVIKLRRNFGQSAALKAGFDTANGSYIVTLDADLQNDPADIPALLKAISEKDLDVVCGWRFNRKDSFTKKISSRTSNTLRKVLIKESIHDSGCTLRIYKRECVEDIELYGEMHRYIPAILSYNGYRVGEIKSNHRERKYGKSKYNWRRLFKGFADLLVITFWSRFSARPMHIFGTFGLLISIVGSLTLVIMVAERLLLSRSLSDRPLFILAIMSIIVGLQFFAFGIMADISLKTYYRQNNFKNYRVEKVIGRGITGRLPEEYEDTDS
ncbi:glycosyltransferase family 2 protein [Methanocella sp. MCL-LM]|uniref:glycosyltransferase family 2 protein n=1 Tax=Methanocella sp. MCL-LM TaxID=3412035 RepID=UPI003C7147A4